MTALCLSKTWSLSAEATCPRRPLLSLRMMLFDDENTCFMRVQVYGVGLRVKGGPRLKWGLPSGVPSKN